MSLRRSHVIALSIRLTPKKGFLPDGLKNIKQYRKTVQSVLSKKTFGYLDLSKKILKCTQVLGKHN